MTDKNAVSVSLKDGVDVKELATRLRLLALDQDRAGEALNDIGWGLPEVLTHDFGRLFFDLVGVPKEKGFCRDYLYDCWYRYVDGDLRFETLMGIIDDVTSDYYECLLNNRITINRED